MALKTIVAVLLCQYALAAISAVDKSHQKHLRARPSIQKTSATGEELPREWSVNKTDTANTPAAKQRLGGGLSNLALADSLLPPGLLRAAADWLPPRSSHLRSSLTALAKRARLVQGSSGASEEWEVAVPTVVAGQSEHPEEKEARLLGNIIGNVLYAVLVFLVAVWYSRNKLTPLVPPEAAAERFKDGDFEHGPFRCFEEPELSLWACCFPALRWGNTMNALGLLSFWVAVAVFVGLSFLENTATFLAVLVVLTFTYARQQLRKVHGMRNGYPDMAVDCLLWSFCCCCAIVQEARHVDDLAAASSAPEAAPKEQEQEGDA